MAEAPAATSGAELQDTRGGMWVRCPRVLDEPVRILGLEPEDFTSALAMPTMLSLLLDALPALLSGIAFGVTMYFLKRGKPPGDLSHQLYSLELLPLQWAGIVGTRPRLYTPWELV